MATLAEKEWFIKVKWDVDNNITAESHAEKEFEIFCDQAYACFEDEYEYYWRDIVKSDFERYIEQLRYDDGWYEDEVALAINA